MKVFQILFDVADVDKKITQERHYWIAPSLNAAAAVAGKHAYEYEKDLTSVSEVITITQKIKQEEADQAFIALKNYESLPE